MTKKEKIAWAMARYLDNSNTGTGYLIETRYKDDYCEYCDSEKETEEEVLSSKQIEDLYGAYQAAKRLDKGR